jgi:hypothetical protein
MRSIDEFSTTTYWAFIARIVWNIRGRPAWQNAKFFNVRVGGICSHHKCKILILEWNN